MKLVFDNNERDRFVVILGQGLDYNKHFFVIGLLENCTMMVYRDEKRAKFYDALPLISVRLNTDGYVYRLHHTMARGDIEEGVKEFIRVENEKLAS